VARKLAKSDLGQNGCFPNSASSGGVDVVASAGPGPDVEVYDSSLPEEAPPGSMSRFECFRARLTTQLLTDSVPAFNYLTLSNDHTAGTTPGRRDSQDGADHVDAHRIPAFAISPYAKRGAVVHTRYDFLSFIKTLEVPIGMKPLNVFDNLAVPLYDAFTPNPDNDEPYTAIRPDVNLTERNTASSPQRHLLAGTTARSHRRHATALSRPHPVAVRARRGLGASTAGTECLWARRRGLEEVRGPGARRLTESASRAR